MDMFENMPPKLVCFKSKILGHVPIITARIGMGSVMKNACPKSLLMDHILILVDIVARSRYLEHG